jgi:hypothetical protein
MFKIRNPFISHDLKVMRAVAASNEIIDEENRKRLAAGCPRYGAKLVDDGHGGVCPVWGCGR